MDIYLPGRTVFLIATLLALCAAEYSYRYWHKHVMHGERDFDYCVADIRAMNTYNSYMLTAILVFFGFVLDGGWVLLPECALELLLFAFGFASAAIFFIPVKKPPYLEPSSGILRLWIYTLILSQTTVIFTVTAVAYIGIFGIGGLG